MENLEELLQKKSQEYREIARKRDKFRDKMSEESVELYGKMIMPKLKPEFANIELEWLNYERDLFRLDGMCMMLEELIRNRNINLEEIIGVNYGKQK